MIIFQNPDNGVITMKYFASVRMRRNPKCPIMTIGISMTSITSEM